MEIDTYWEDVTIYYLLYENSKKKKISHFIIILTEECEEKMIMDMLKKKIQGIQKILYVDYFFEGLRLKKKDY